MVERIPQHKHCRQCGKAFIGTSEYCSTECAKAGEEILKKRKKQLIILYVMTLIILTVAVLAMAVR